MTNYASKTTYYDKATFTGGFLLLFDKYLKFGLRRFLHGHEKTIEQFPVDTTKPMHCLLDTSRCV